MNAGDLRRIRRGIVVCLVVLVASGGCQNPGSDSRGETRAGAAGQGSQTVTGTVRYIDLEGGFYGIETDDGKKLDPVNLPREFQQEGLRIQARVEELKDRASIHMWGTLVRIIEFKRL